MRIQRPTPQILVARNAANGPRLVSAVVTAAAAVLASAGLASHQTAIMWAGAACLLIAIAIWRGDSAQVITLDRANGVVQIRTQHVLGTSSVVHPFGDISDVVLERRPTGDGRVEFHPAFVMRNGTHQGWGTHTLDHAQPDAVTAVRQVREFLGTAGSPTAPDGSPAIQES